MNKEYQEQLITETANRLAADGNKSAASCLYNIASAMCIDYETILSKKLHEHMDAVLRGILN